MASADAERSFDSAIETLSIFSLKEPTTALKAFVPSQNVASPDWLQYLVVDYPNASRGLVAAPVGEAP